MQFWPGCFSDGHLRDAVLVKGAQLAAVLLSGLLVQVEEVLHGRHAAFRRLLGNIQLLYKMQGARTFICELVRTAVVTLLKTGTVCEPHINIVMSVIPSSHR